MALVGQLEDLGLTELFHLLSLFQKTGKLTLNGDRKTGIFLFQNGKLVHAADGTPRMPLGNLLVERGMVTRSQLDEALDIQREEGGRRRVGSILVELGALSSEALEGVVRGQLQEVAEDFLHRKSGFFSFKPTQEGDSKEEHGHPDGVELATGMNTDHFILEILTKLDEVGSDGEAPLNPGIQGPAAVDVPAIKDGEGSEESLHKLLDYMVDPRPYADMAETETVNVEDTGDLSELRSLMVEIQLRSPSFTGEITLLILRYATKVLNRGVLCRVAEEGISGIGQFGIESSGESVTSADRRVREMTIPIHEPSVFFEVVENMHTFHGPLRKCKWNDYLVRQLGGGQPHEVVAIPIVVDGMIIAIFYGDNLPDHRPVGSIQGLELLMIEAGLAIERKLLRAKLRQVEEQLRKVTT